jgi:dGTPase
MNWKKLLSSKRLGRNEADFIAPGRSPFQQDFDRIVFSSAFRRLQDKAQVFPLAENDYVRTRLTHSLESSSIGRSLGARAGQYLCDKYDLDLQPSDIGAITGAAALAHDIGNPPLGHSGEEAIRHWFCNSPVVAADREEMSALECADIERYEGNAQGFRVLARLQMPDNPGGMQLSCATLGAFTKYPVESKVENAPKAASFKKFNFFQVDKELFAEVAEATGLKKYPYSDYCWARHPLAFLVEAADDICYHIVDFEDGRMLNIIHYDELERLFMAIIQDSAIEARLKNIDSETRKVELLRAKALGKLVNEVSRAFMDYEEQALAGELDCPLLDLIPSKEPLQVILDRSAEKIYTYRRAVEIEAAGYELTEGLLDAFYPCIKDMAENEKVSYRTKKMLQLIPEHYYDIKSEEWRNSRYYRLICLLDFISGMTDSYAVSLFKKIRGISLPGRI